VFVAAFEVFRRSGFVYPWLNTITAPVGIILTIIDLLVIGFEKPGR